MTLAGIRIKLHPLTPLVFMLAAAFTGGGTLICTLCALGVHEAAHLLTALRLRARIDEIELMPFGGAIRLQTLWEISGARLALISLAGPLANLLSACLLALLVYAFPALAANTQALIEFNLIILLFNMLPALPLDGGRALCALIARRVGQRRAVNAGIWAGRALAACLLALTVCAFIARGKIPLYPALCAVYIIASGERERRQAEGALLRAVLMAGDAPRAPSEARWLVARESDSVYDAARSVSPGRAHLIAVLGEDGEIKGALSQQFIARALTRDSTAPLGALVRAPKAPSDKAERDAGAPLSALARAARPEDKK